MFDHKHYVPVLKGKLGEFNALRNLQGQAQISHFTPLIEVMPIPAVYGDGENEPSPSKSIGEHIEGVAAAIAKATKHLPSIFVDGFYIESEDDLEDGPSPIDGLFTRLRSDGINFIPVVGLDRVEDYADSVKEAIKTDNRGCCLRLVEADIDGIAELDAQVKSLLTELTVTKSNVDLIVDFGWKVPQRAVLPFLIDALPSIKEWRSFTMVSSCFPPDMTDVQKNSIKEIERDDWITWLSLRSKTNVARVPTFGDYGINHPVLPDFNPLTMTVSPNIRYTDTLNYVVAKGQAQPRKKWADTPQKKEIRAELAPSVQFPKLAKKITKHPAWKGKDFSWGDAFIDKCSRKECVGSGTDWRAVGMSHHISLVLQQISNLP
jgi:hypothetical protein